MSIHAIYEALRAAAAAVDPIVAMQTLANHLDACPAPGLGLCKCDLDDLSIAPIVEELERYVQPAKPRAYVCHPVSAFKPDGSYDVEGMKANLANARKWLRWFVDNTNWSVSMPWMPYVEELDEETYRERGIEDDLNLIDGHSLVVMVSDQMSSGMTRERHYTQSRLIPLIDLTNFGCFAPPAPGTDAFELLRKVLDAIVPGTVKPLPAAV